MNLTDFEYKMNFPTEHASRYLRVRTLPLKKWVGYLKIEKNKLQKPMYIFELHFLDNTTDRVCIDYEIPVREYYTHHKYHNIKNILKELENKALNFCKSKGIKPYIIEEQNAIMDEIIKGWMYLEWKLQNLKY